MKEKMIEIGSIGLFNEYLQGLGIRKPPLDAIESHWEYRREDKLTAMVTKTPSGEVRCYLDARAISLN
ncbi:hypothetical protein ACW5WQ_18030 [Aeromonas rivuli]|uniref:hypothetical protein n=1 Tax=Aeromonas TaxID=642 RepID=UPI0005AA65A4|nr:MULTISPECIES: hypothetical protein [Aeromonas]MCS3457826.1 hypothetical protein [Aeromonas sp. BIGb0405]MCS3461868.1 hypothetical protein [Aeromonas sp. BIGb0445]UBO74008.1 hypothetical protein KYK33_19885 [Aeromonas rivuli]